MLKHRAQPVITSITHLQLLSDEELRDEAERRGDTLALIICQRLDDAQEQFDTSKEIRRMEDDHDAECAAYEREIVELEEDVAELMNKVCKLESQLADAETVIALLGGRPHHG